MLCSFGLVVSDAPCCTHDNEKGFLFKVYRTDLETSLVYALF